jgi:plasmid maintenance system killer protein
VNSAVTSFWAVAVRANWRVIFRFEGDAEDVDYVDYH